VFAVDGDDITAEVHNELTVAVDTIDIVLLPAKGRVRMRRRMCSLANLMKGLRRKVMRSKARFMMDMKGAMMLWGMEAGRPVL